MNNNILNFPLNYSLGRLLTHSKNERKEWVEIAQAKGDVIVSGDLDLWLEISSEKDIEISSLSGFDRDALQFIDVTLANLPSTDFKYIEHLYLLGIAAYETNLEDEALSHIGNIVTLKWLDIGTTKVTNQGLKHLAPLVSLKELILLNNHIGDEGLIHLSKMTELQHLDLMGTKVSDNGIVHLKKLQSLNSLRIFDTSISEKGYLEIKATIPNCNIKYKHYLHFDD